MISQHAQLHHVLLRFWAVALALGCTEVVEVGSSAELATGNGGSSGATQGCDVTKCQGHIYQCGDCYDNDGDGLTDSDDPDCLGACDNTEESFYGGIPGQNNAPCVQDCFFDQDTGAGNDQCYWSHACDALSVSPTFGPSADQRCEHNPDAVIPGTAARCDDLAMQQLDACRVYCVPLTPNGCDCFGCCELPTGSNRFVWLGSTSSTLGSCDLASVDDPTRCHPCTPVPSCFNGCGPCEVCIGRPRPSTTCTSSGNERCETDVQPCGQKNEPPCPAGQYCVTGCCIEAPE
jgi:hypothetical protein